MNETKAARSPGRVNLVPDHMTKQSYAVVIVCFLCWMFSTIGNGVYSVASPMLQEMFGMSTATSGLVVSAFSLGGWVSTLVLPKIADKYGRRLCLGICVIIIVVCNGTYGLIGSIGMLFVVRFFCNWGNTCIWAVNASYISEMVPAKQRAFYTGIMQSGTPIGNFLSSFLISILVGIGLSSYPSSSYSRRAPPGCRTSLSSPRLKPQKSKPRRRPPASLPKSRATPSSSRKNTAKTSFSAA